MVLGSTSSSSTRSRGWSVAAAPLMPGRGRNLRRSARTSRTWTEPRKERWSAVYRTAPPGQTSRAAASSLQFTARGSGRPPATSYAHARGSQLHRVTGLLSKRPGEHRCRNVQECGRRSGAVPKRANSKAQQPPVCSWATQVAKSGEIKLRWLVKEALRMRPGADRRGEVRQEEGSRLRIATGNVLHLRGSGSPGMMARGREVCLLCTSSFWQSLVTVVLAKEGPGLVRARARTCMHPWARRSRGRLVATCRRARSRSRPRRGLEFGVVA